MSSEHTSRFIGPFLRWLAPDISDATVASIQLLVRKCAHLAGYAILAALLYRAFRQGRYPFRPGRCFRFLIAALYAALDEFHQSFVPSRTGTPRDVMIDCIGAAIGLALCLAFPSETSALRRLTNHGSPITIPIRGEPPPPGL